MADEFDDWYAAARPRVLAAIVALVGDVDRAQDATDEAFLRAISRWERVRSMSSPTGWVVTVGQNVARRTARRATLERRILRRQRGRGDTAEPAGETWSLVRTLPPRQRDVIVLRYVVDLPEAEIASTLGISRSAVSSALTDARRALAAALLDAERSS